MLWSFPVSNSDYTSLKRGQVGVHIYFWGFWGRWACPWSGACRRRQTRRGRPGRRARPEDPPRGFAARSAAPRRRFRSCFALLLSRVFLFFRFLCRFESSVENWDFFFFLWFLIHLSNQSSRTTTTNQSRASEMLAWNLAGNSFLGFSFVRWVFVWTLSDSKLIRI